jgi:deoxyadenosine/deoxycytidine kinase
MNSMNTSMNTSMNISMNTSMNISIEGCIGAGKSKFINLLELYLSSHGVSCHAVEEPIDQWVDASGTSLLEQYYVNPIKWACTLQQCILLIQTANVAKLRRETSGTLLIERYGAGRDRGVFYNMHTDSGLIDYGGQRVLDLIKETCPRVPIHLYIYLHVPLETCYSRMTKRCRKSEDSISREYLSTCWNYHEAIFKPSEDVMIIEWPDIDTFTDQYTIDSIFLPIYNYIVG